MKNIHLLGLEPIETRYTKEWYEHLGPMLNNGGFHVIEYDGEQVSQNVLSTSDFLNWTGTNIYKSSQLINFAKNINNISDNDIIFISDFWNPCVIQIKYMLTMLGIKAKIVGIAHAGAYDPWDRLALKTKGDKWISYAEQGIMQCYDKIFVGTQFHYDLIQESYGADVTNKLVIAGYPFDYVNQDINLYFKKEKIISFVQRNAKEKQPELFDLLSQDPRFSEYKFVNVSNKTLTKDEYHDILKKSEYVISFALQETLGITPFEAMAYGCNILVPNRLSYREMYPSIQKYANDGNDLDNCANLLYYYINDLDHATKISIIKDSFKNIKSKFFSINKMLDDLKEVC